MNKAILRIPYDDLLLVIAPLSDPRRMLAPDTLPAGTAILGVHENHACRAFDWILQHESFPPCAKGCMLPLLPAPVWLDEYMPKQYAKSTKP